MKVLAFNASPRRDRGNTNILIDQFIEGLKKGGAEVDKHHIVDLDIKGCIQMQKTCTKLDFP